MVHCSSSYIIADIDKDIVDALIKSFADDTRAAKGVRTKEDVAALQHVLEKLYEWSDENNMSLNDKKFEGVRKPESGNQIHNSFWKNHRDKKVIERSWCHNV